MLNKRNRDYWKNRAEELEARAHAISTEALMELESQFDRASREIQLEIERWYARLAKNNNVSPAEAMALLSARELKEFRWTVEEYIKFAEENELSGAWVRELENASAKFHITRLEALKLKVQHQVEKVFGNELDTVDGMISKVYTDGYYHNCFELSKGFGVGFAIAAIDGMKLEILKRKPWAPDGQNFSSRIWTNKREMVGTLHQELTRQALLGSSLDEAIATMSKFVDKKFRVAKTRAAALVRTEQAAFASAAQKDAYKVLGIERYEIVATLDSRTSEICRDMDGKHFPLSEFVPGVTAPPFHVRCRTTTCPYFNDEFTVDEKRAARDEDGNLYYVPADMTYREWEKEYVKDSISPQTKRDFAKHGSVFGDKALPLEEFLKIRYNKNEWQMFKSYASAIKSGELTPLADFEHYKGISKEMDEKLVGIITSNGITITGKTNHSIARVIGSVEQKRNGVDIFDMIKALEEPDEVKPVRYNKNGASQKFILNQKCIVSVNPDTGLIVQVNPFKR